MTTVDLGDRLAQVRTRIDDATGRSGRREGAVTLLAVTKGHSVATVAAAVAAGLHDIGESRVAEARAKQESMAQGGARGDTEPTLLRWHLIGHLQQNKARTAAEIFDVVHSIDSVRIAAALARRREAGPRLPVLLEVELTGLPMRSGITPDVADSMVEALQGFPQLELAGLMTIAAPGPPEGARALFARLRALRDGLRGRHGVALAELSMGMSDDFEVAIEEGATVVRLGRVLFGSRPS